MCVNRLPEMLKLASAIVVESRKTGQDLNALVAKHASAKGFGKTAVNSLIASTNQQFQDLTGETNFDIASRDSVYNILYSSPEKTASVDYSSEYHTKLASYHGRDTVISGQVVTAETFNYKQACLELLEQEEYAVKKAHAVLTGKLEKIDIALREEVAQYKDANYTEDSFLQLFNGLAPEPSLLLKAAFAEAPKSHLDSSLIRDFEYTKNPTKLANMANEYYDLYLERNTMSQASAVADSWRNKIASSEDSDLDATTKSVFDKTASMGFSNFVSGLSSAVGRLGTPSKEYPQVQTNIHSDAISSVISNDANLSRAHQIASALVGSGDHSKVTEGLSMLKNVTDQAAKHISNTTLNPIKQDPNVYDRFVNAGVSAAAIGGTALATAGLYQAAKKLHQHLTKPRLTPEMKAAMIAHVPELQNLSDERLQKHFDDISRLAPRFSSQPTQMAMLINGIKSFGGVTLDTGKSLIDTETKFNQRDSKGTLDSLGSVLSKSIK